MKVDASASKYCQGIVLRAAEEDGGVLRKSAEARSNVVKDEDHEFVLCMFVSTPNPSLLFEQSGTVVRCDADVDS